ncbi:ATPase-AAA-core domain-containing protein [Favolaschia claudopus]|uniref:ATPase-AAA-core domain-containing protein n=1 Tax=Favolaschia claudopus TaxID=2862362 RepID=A0AAV9Z895_9AGAR
MTSLFKPLVTILHALDDALGPPFIHPMSTVLQGLIDAVRGVKQNKSECIELMETTHKIICEIVNLHIKAEVPGSLPVDTLNHIGRFVETLRKIYVFLEAQQDGNKIKQLFRLAEGNNLLKDCQAGLAQAVEVFKIDTTLKLITNSQELEERLENMHQELLRLIQESSDAATTTSDMSSVSCTSSSNSFSFLPPIPKVFHGRDSEVQIILEMFENKMLPRIAILGGGGMGKTSLARVVLHHPYMLAKFKHRFFVSAESAGNSIDLAALVGLHVGLDPAPDLTNSVVHYFQKTQDCLLVLDNLETIWDIPESQHTVEQFLSMLDDVAHLALIVCFIHCHKILTHIMQITMRGVERPKKVQWTRPFLPPLQPLSQDAALQTFMDITDNSYDTEEINRVLQFTDYMPLAVDLMANLVDYEGLSTISTRWEEEHTSALAMGYDRRSNLDVSIGLSLSSPRVTAQSKELLSLLSILPDGLSDVELVQSKLPIIHVLKCKSILLATSLAYQDNKQRLRSLVPVKEYMQQYMPPSQAMIQCLQAYFYSVSRMYTSFQGEELHYVINQITRNLANLQQILQQGLNSVSSNIKDVIYCVLNLNSFYRITGRQSMPLMDQVESMLPMLADKHIEANFLVEDLLSYRHKWLLSEEWIAENLIPVFNQISDVPLQAKFYGSLGTHFLNRQLTLVLAKKYFQIAYDLSESSGNTLTQCSALEQMCVITWACGNYKDADIYASKAQQLSRLSGSFYEEAQACIVKAHLLIDAGDFKEAISEIKRSQQAIHICGLSGGHLHYIALSHQAEIHLKKSEFTEAQMIFDQVLQNTSADNNDHSYAYALINSVYIEIAKDEVTSHTAQKLGTARTILGGLGRDVLVCDMIEAELTLKHGNINLARLQFDKVLSTARGSNRRVEPHCLEKLGNPKLWPSSERQPISTLVYLSYAIHCQQKLEVHKALLFLGDILVAEDELTAMALYTVALEGFTFMDIHQYRAECMLRLGDLVHKQGDQVKAKTFWLQARQLFEQSSQTKSVAVVDSQLTCLKDSENNQHALEKLVNLQVPGQIVSALIERSGVEIEHEVTGAVE